MYKYYVSENQLLTPTTVLLTLKKDLATKPFLFQPGQYAAISYKKKGVPTPVRCFSMVNSPLNHNTLQFSVRIFGRYTKGMARLKLGDEVNVRGPFGGFVIDQDRDLDIVMLAGGIGITPLVSIIHYVTNIKLPNKISLIYSCKSQDDIPFIEQLKDLAAMNPNFKLNFVVSEGPIDNLTGCSARSGRITPEVIEQINGESYTGKKFFICGPSAFMGAMAKSLKENGVSADSIVTEAFNGGPNGQPGNIHSWPFNVYLFGAAGVVMASFAVLLSDLLASLPASSLIGTSSMVDSSNSTNSRQNELDKLVNALPTISPTAPVTDAATTTSTPSINNVTTNTPVISKPVVTPAPAPKCTTTQSGVTTCV